MIVKEDEKRSNKVRWNASMSSRYLFSIRTPVLSQLEFALLADNLYAVMLRSQKAANHEEKLLVASNRTCLGCVFARLHLTSLN